MPAQRERAVELVVKMGMTVRIISRSSSSTMLQQRDRIFDVAIDAADAVHGVVDAIAGDCLQHVHHLFAQRKAGHEHGFEAHELGGDAGPENMRVQALELGHDDANVLGARRRSEAGELLHGLAEREGVNVRADAADALHERDDLDVVARFGQMLDAAEVETDVQLGIGDGFAFADHVELVRFFEAGMVRAHGDFVAHFSTSFCRGSGLGGLRHRAGSRPACRLRAAAAARIRGR